MTEHETIASVTETIRQRWAGVTFDVSVTVPEGKGEDDDDPWLWVRIDERPAGRFVGELVVERQDAPREPLIELDEPTDAMLALFELVQHAPRDIATLQAELDEARSQVAELRRQLLKIRSLFTPGAML